MALSHKYDPPKPSDNPLGPPGLKAQDSPDLKAQDSIADTLRLARQEHGQDLRTVAQVLRIRHAYLEAIERGDFEHLPCTAYAIGFLRTYAEFLGLDGEQIVERFKHEAQGVEPKMDLVFPEPVSQNRIPGGAIVLISMVLLGLAYGGWFYFSNQDQSIADLMPPPEPLQATSPTTSPATSPATSPGQDGGQGGATPEVESAAAEGSPDAAPGDSPDAAPMGAPGDTPGDADGGAVASAEAVTYTPPESAGTENQTPAPAPTFESAEGDVAAPEAAEAIYIQAPEVGETTGPQVSGGQGLGAPGLGVMAKITPPIALSPPAGAETARSTATGDAAPGSDMTKALMRHPTTNSAGSVEPMLDETVVIPAPPTATRDMVLSTERFPRVYGESNRGTRIVLRALEDSWVQVRDRQDALLLTRVLRRGDTYYVPNQDGLTLLTGNAGGIAIEVDGVALSPLGPIGAVRRQIALDPARLLSGTAQPH